MLRLASETPWGFYEDNDFSSSLNNMLDNKVVDITYYILWKLKKGICRFINIGILKDTQLFPIFFFLHTGKRSKQRNVLNSSDVVRGERGQRQESCMRYRRSHLSFPLWPHEGSVFHENCYASP